MMQSGFANDQRSGVHDANSRLAGISGTLRDTACPLESNSGTNKNKTTEFNLLLHNGTWIPRSDRSRGVSISVLLTVVRDFY